MGTTSTVLDGAQRQFVDVDDVVVVGHTGAHEVDLGRPTGEERARRIGTDQGDGLGDVDRPGVGQGPHDGPAASSRT
jgi:hypothetical protein